MDAMDEVRSVAKVGGVVDFVLENDTRDFVGEEAQRLRRVGSGEVEVGIEGARLDSEHEISYCGSISLRCGWRVIKRKVRYLSSPCWRLR